MDNGFILWKINNKLQLMTKIKNFKYNYKIIFFLIKYKEILNLLKNLKNDLKERTKSLLYPFSKFFQKAQLI